MDYPFFMHKIGQLTQAEVDAFMVNVQAAGQQEVDATYFDPGSNKGVQRVDSPEVDAFANAVLMPKLAPWGLKKLIWHEINAIEPGAIMKEHADFESTAFDPWKCKKPYYGALEVTLCHKIHVHLKGDSLIYFRRSRKEEFETFAPEVGGIYFFNNYVLHRSTNPGTIGQRWAMTLVIDDRNWMVKKKLLQELNLRYYQTYDGRETFEA